jgi:SAM-dependent methyltransferase
LDGDARVRKSAAITASVSQLKRGPNGEEPILPREVLAHFERGTEVFFREPPTRSARRSRFSNLYRAEADPWQVSSRWYERRKRATALAALPDERYGAAVEPACGTGAFTRELGPRCERLLAFDPVPAAVDQARAATAGLPQVRVQIGEVPGDLPAEPVDLLVYSEILYYLDDEDLARTIERSVAALRPGGHLLAAHWLPWAPEAPRDGRDAHRHLLTHSALETLVEHSDEDFLLHVLRRR